MFSNDLLRFKSNIKYTVFDVESYNLALNFSFNACWSVGIIQTNDFKIINTQEILINWLNEKPDLLIEPEVAIKNHYSKENILKHGLNPKEAFNIFYPYLNDCDYILAQNIWGFDIYLLKEYCNYMNKPWKHFLPKIIDTNAIAKGLKTGNIFDSKKESFIEYSMRCNNIIKRGIKTNLKQLCRDYDIEFDDNLYHGSSYDCQKTLDVWKKMVWLIEL